MEAIKTPLTAASMYRAWRSAGFPGKLELVSTGVWFRARIATPFQERSPCQTASKPSARRAFLGNAPCSALSSCKHTTFGWALASQARRLSSRLLMSLMLKVAIFTIQYSTELSRSNLGKALSYLPVFWPFACGVVLTPHLKTQEEAEQSARFLLLWR
jgi:hypothetical protein